MTQNNEREALLDKLLAEYWDIAYSEGNSGLWHGKKAQATLNDIRKLFKTQSTISQNEQQEVVAWRYVDSRGNYRYRSYVDDFDVKYKSLKPVKLYTSPPKQIPDGWKLVPIEPSDDHLKSMAIRSDHGLGVEGYYDTKPIQFGASHAQRMESTIREMRQLYEEAIGEGFYKLPEAPTTSLTSETNTEVGE